MNYLVLTSAPDAGFVGRWNEFLRDAHLPTAYASPAYFTDPYIAGERTAVFAVEGDRIEAVATGVTTADRFTGGMFSRPQVCFRRGADEATAIDAITEGIASVIGDASLTELYLWDGVPDVDTTTSNSDNSVVMLDLRQGADAIFGGFSQTRRNELRKAERLGLVEVKDVDTEAELRELYDIILGWNKRKGTTPSTFDQLATAVSQHTHRKTLIAKADGKVIAGSFYRFVPGGVVEYAANYSVPEFQRLRPNDIIGWNAIRWAAASGFSHFSMGGSHLFLRRFGGDIIRTHRLIRDTRKFSVARMGKGVREAGVDVYRRSPASVKNIVRKVFAR